MVYGLFYLEMGYIIVCRYFEDIYEGFCLYYGDCLEGFVVGLVINKCWD